MRLVSDTAANLVFLFMPRTTCARRALVLTLAAASLAACGGTDDPAEATATITDADEAGRLTVLAEDISFPSDTYRAAAGTVRVTYENVGSIVHTLVIEDVDDFKLTVDSNGDVDEGSVGLEPGAYEMYCDVPGHRQAGMEATLEVS